MLSVLFAASLAFAETKELALQIHLDRAGFSCSAIDGVWGRKAEQALCAYRTAHDPDPASARLTPAQAFDRYFAEAPDPFRIETVTEDDLGALVRIPDDPAEKARLPRLGYESIREMFAERGHLSQKALVKMNPGVDWDHVTAGIKLVIPDFPSISATLRKAERKQPGQPVAALVRISIANATITALDADGRALAFFPCSVAARKSKIPPHGELKITDYIAWPNYTYTPDFTPPGRKIQRHVWPSGENCPVGVAWIGLNLPGYGIHGTPRPESIGYAGSHGCFRLANWNAARLFALCRPNTRVVIE